ncbi:MAG: 3-mercaptopropionate dioxygenase [Fimbriimonadaceae bacterium]|nr:3-mercaptopropionate dioxygenase [Fimbriimonadaceae bacterium]
MTTATLSPKMRELIGRLDTAVEEVEVKGCCMSVKQALEEIVQSGEDFVDRNFLQPAQDRYARRLIHLDPDNKYSLMAMVWGKGQGTAIHDHAHMWCVECVYRGRIKVVSFDLRTPEDAELLQFEQQQTIFAGPGEAGALIPPFEYHTIENPDDTPAVTLHVYGGEMKWCHVFLPTEGGYRREYRELSYTD